MRLGCSVTLLPTCAIILDLFCAVLWFYYYILNLTYFNSEVKTYCYKNNKLSLRSPGRNESRQCGEPCGFSHYSQLFGERGNGKATLFRKSPTLALGGDLPRHFLKACMLRAKTVKAHKCIFGTFVAMDKSTY